MIRFCTIISANENAVTQALVRSLIKHVSGFHLTIFIADEFSADAIVQLAPQQISLVSLLQLSRNEPELHESLRYRKGFEGAQHLRPWCLQYLLSQVGANEFLTLVEPSVFFYHSPEPLLRETGSASLVLIRNPESITSDASIYDRSWISLKNNPTGNAIASAWLRRSLDQIEQPWVKRHSLIRLESSFPEIQKSDALIRTGIHAPTANLSSYTVQAGPFVAGEALFAFNFAGINPLGEGVYDPGPVIRQLEPNAPFRQLVCQPYLDTLASSGPSMYAPDFIPFSDPADTRAHNVLQLVLAETAAQKSIENELNSALAKALSKLERLEQDTRARTKESERYIHHIEQDRDQQRQSFFNTRKRLEEIHQDLLNNIAYLKKLEADVDAHKKAAQEREAYISNLKDELAAQRSTGGSGTDLVRLHENLIPHSSKIRRLLIARFNPALMPLILSISAQGVIVEVLASPPSLQGKSHGSIHFLGGDLWDWLSGINSHFDEDTYLSANTDVASAIKASSVSSAWDHYLRFGQFEGRNHGIAEYRNGLADFDAIAFDSADATDVVPCLIGRLQPHHQLFISSSFNPATVWLPTDTPRTIILDDLLHCARPSPAWLGPAMPSALSVPNRKTGPSPISYPDTPTQPAVWPRITIIITALNQAEPLRATLASVFSQLYPMQECIVVDRGSNDGSINAIESYSSKLSWWTSKANLNVPQSLNLGLSKSNGAFIVWLQAGDLLTPGSLYTVGQQVLLHAPDIIGGRCKATLPDGTAGIQRSVLSVGRLQTLPLDVLLDVSNFWFRDAFFRQPAIFYSQKTIQNAGGRWPESPASNFEMTLAIARTGARVLPIPEVLAVQAESELQQSDISALKAIITNISTQLHE